MQWKSLKKILLSSVIILITLTSCSGDFLEAMTTYSIPPQMLSFDAEGTWTDPGRVLVQWEVDYGADEYILWRRFSGFPSGFEEFQWKVVLNLKHRFHQKETINGASFSGGVFGRNGMLCFYDTPPYQITKIDASASPEAVEYMLEKRSDVYPSAKLKSDSISTVNYYPAFPPTTRLTIDHYRIANKVYLHFPYSPAMSNIKIFRQKYGATGIVPTSSPIGEDGIEANGYKLAYSGNPNNPEVVTELSQEPNGSDSNISVGKLYRFGDWLYFIDNPGETNSQYSYKLVLEDQFDNTLLRITPASTDYACTFVTSNVQDYASSFSDDYDKDDLEPNDKEAAARLCSDSDIVGKLYYMMPQGGGGTGSQEIMDEDWYALQITPGGSILLQIELVTEGYTPGGVDFILSSEDIHKEYNEVIEIWASGMPLTGDKVKFKLESGVGDNGIVKFGIKLKGYPDRFLGSKVDKTKVAFISYKINKRESDGE